MTTWTDILAQLRAELLDTSATPKYSDSLLCGYLRDAVRNYSLYLPLEVYDETLVLETGKTREFCLPTDFTGVLSVQCPEGTYLEQRQDRPGTRVRDLNIVRYYWIKNGHLFVNLDPGSDAVILSYEAIYPYPNCDQLVVTPAVEAIIADPDADPPVVGVPCADPEADPPVEGIDCSEAIPAEDLLLTVPELDIELLKLYVCGKTQVQTRGGQSRLDRFKPGSGSRTDNPIIVEVDDYFARYYAGIAERMGGETIYLHRPARSRIR